jgi:CheY-like chemotaxis protein
MSYQPSAMIPSDPPNLPDEAPPESFIEQIKDVLEHLHDFMYLQQHALVRDWELSGDSPAQSLRRSVLAAIDTLSPGPGVAFRSPNARVYNMLHLRYVEGLTVHQAAHDLNLSLRQAHRDLRRGEESIAAMLWWQRFHPQTEQVIAVDEPLAEMRAEIDRFELDPRPIDLYGLVNRVIQSVTPLAGQQEITLHLDTTAESAIIFTDPVVAQQVLISIVSHAIQHARAGRIYFKGMGKQPGLIINYPVDPSSEELDPQTVTTHLADRLGWSVEQTCENGDRCLIHVGMVAQEPVRVPTVLVIDDNEGLKDLIGRYLSNYACKIVAATSGSQGLQLAEESTPDVIILDIMMPEMDGWEVLQTLRHRALTQEIPVVICSVFNDPRLARSLGAYDLLPKPLRSDDLIKVLNNLELL